MANSAEKEMVMTRAIGAALGERIADSAVIAVSVIALAGVLPELLAAIATIAVAVALLFRGGTTAARFSRLLSETKGGPEIVERWGGMTAEFLAGATGIALGILALLGLARMVLIPIAAIVYGGALVLDSGVTARLDALEIARAGGPELNPEVARETAASAAGIQVLVGLAAVTLGVLALVGLRPLILSLTAMLAIGFADLMSGTAMGGRMLAIFYR